MLVSELHQPIVQRIFRTITDVNNPLTTSETLPLIMHVYCVFTVDYLQTNFTS